MRVHAAMREACCMQGLESMRHVQCYLSGNKEHRRILSLFCKCEECMG